MRPQKTITFRRALLIAAVPGIGMWLQIREEGFADDQPFSRKPGVLNGIVVLVAVGVLLAGVVADSLLLEIIGGFLAAGYGFRPMARLLLPRSMARTEHELLALSTPGSLIHVGWLIFVAYLVVTEQFIAAAVITGMLGVGLIGGAFLLRLMFSGLVGRTGNHAVG